MKFFAAVVLISLTLTGTHGLPNKDTIKQLLKNIRTKLVCGYDGLPVFAPSLHLEHLPININTGSIKANMDLHNLYVVGATGFTVDCSSVLPITVSLNWRKPLIVETEYSGSIKLFDMLNLFGKGKIRLALGTIDINKLKIFIGRDDVDPNKVVITNLMLDKLPITGSHLEITGLFNDEVKSKYISTELLEVLHMLIDEQFQTLFGLLKPMLMDLIGSQIDMTFDDINNGGGIDDLKPCIALY